MCRKSFKMAIESNTLLSLCPFSQPVSLSLIPSRWAHCSHPHTTHTHTPAHLSDFCWFLARRHGVTSRHGQDLIRGIGQMFSSKLRTRIPWRYSKIEANTFPDLSSTLSTGFKDKIPTWKLHFSGRRTTDCWIQLRRSWKVALYPTMVRMLLRKKQGVAN